MRRRLALWVLASAAIHIGLVALVVVLVGFPPQPLPMLFVDLVHGLLAAAERTGAGARGDGTAPGAAGERAPGADATQGSPSRKGGARSTPPRESSDGAPAPASPAPATATPRTATRGAGVARPPSATPGLQTAHPREETPPPSAARPPEEAGQPKTPGQPEAADAAPPVEAPGFSSGPVDSAGRGREAHVRVAEAAPVDRSPISPPAEPPSDRRSDGQGAGATGAGDALPRAGVGGGEAIGPAADAASSGVRGGGNARGAGGAGAGAGGRGSAGDGAGLGVGVRDGSVLALAIPGDGQGAAREYEGYVALLRRRVQEALAYPSAARRRELSGTVQIDVEILPTGAIAAVTLAGSSSHRVLDEAALEAAREVDRLPFPPGVRPRALRVRLPVHFDLRARP